MEIFIIIIIFYCLNGPGNLKSIAEHLKVLLSESRRAKVSFIHRMVLSSRHNGYNNIILMLESLCFPFGSILFRTKCFALNACACQLFLLGWGIIEWKVACFNFLVVEYKVHKVCI